LLKSIIIAQPDRRFEVFLKKGGFYPPYFLMQQIVDLPAAINGHGSLTQQEYHPESFHVKIPLLHGMNARSGPANDRMTRAKRMHTQT
jgi:hypothetical protein